MQKFTVKESIQYGWKVTKGHFWFFVGLLLILGLVSFLLNFFSNLVEDNIPVFILLNIVSVAINTVLGMGVLFISLKFLDDESASYEDLLAPAHLFLRYLLASALYMLIVLVGFILFIVPGIIWAIKYGFFRFLIIEKKMGIMEALKKSAVMTKGSKWTIFWLSLVIGGLNMLGALALFVGLFVTIPISIMAYAYAYRRLLSESPSQSITPTPEQPT